MRRLGVGRLGPTRALPITEALFVQPLLAVLQARIHRSRRDLELAENALGQLVANVDSPSWVRELELLEIAALHLAQAHPDQAIAVIDCATGSAFSASGSRSESRHGSRRLVAVRATGRHRGSRGTIGRGGRSLDRSGVRPS